MTYAIETDLGRFEGDNEKDAKRKLRKATAEQRKKDAAEHAKYNRAMDQAHRNAYAVYEYKGRGKKMPRGWRILPVTKDSYSCRLIEGVNECKQRKYRIETDKGNGFVSPYDDITHYLENGAGFCMAVVIEKQDCELFAVGIHEGRVAWVSLPGIKAAEFSQPKEGDGS